MLRVFSFFLQSKLATEGRVVSFCRSYEALGEDVTAKQGKRPPGKCSVQEGVSMVDGFGFYGLRARRLNPSSLNVSAFT